jgi:acyl carrier protein
MNPKMTEDEIRQTVLRTLARIAPEVDGATLKPDVSFRDQIDLDSMDLLNFVIALDKECNVAVPESDYPKLATLDGCVTYLAQAFAQHAKL